MGKKKTLHAKLAENSKKILCKLTRGQNEAMYIEKSGTTLRLPPIIHETNTEGLKHIETINSCGKYKTPSTQNLGLSPTPIRTWGARAM